VYFIGIDFSINHPAVCITKDFKSWKWIGGINTNISKKFEEFLSNISKKNKNLSFFYINSKKKKEKLYYINERNKLNNYVELINRLITEIKKETKSAPVIITIEGISFGSTGNILVDLSQATGMLRKALVENILKNKTDSFFVFSPGELKNAIEAKGNASKVEVYKQFLLNPIIDGVTDSDLYKVLKEDLKDGQQIFNGKVIKSPFMDMIDSYLAVLKIHEIIN